MAAGVVGDAAVGLGQGGVVVSGDARGNIAYRRGPRVGVVGNRHVGQHRVAADGRLYTGGLPSPDERNAGASAPALSLSP